MKFNVQKLVLDPVMISESGHRLLEEKAVQTLKDKLFPIAGLITPNLSEASVLTGIPVRTRTDMKKAARIIKERTRGNVLIKGGHLSGAAVDLFFDGTLSWNFPAPVSGPETLMEPAALYRPLLPPFGDKVFL